MSVFTQVNLAPEQEPAATQAYGNRTGGVIQGNTNITTHSFQAAKNRFDTGDVRSWMSTVPEAEYLLSELERRNISHRFGGLFLHDDTVTQVSYVERVADREQQIGGSGAHLNPLSFFLNPLGFFLRASIPFIWGVLSAFLRA